MSRACVPATKTAMSEMSACAFRCAASTAGTSGRPYCNGRSGSAASTSSSAASSAIASRGLPLHPSILLGLDVLSRAVAAVLTGRDVSQYHLRSRMLPPQTPQGRLWKSTTLRGILKH